MTSPIRRILAHYWRVADVRWLEVAIPVTLMLAAAGAEAFAFALLLPLTEAVSENGFGFLSESRFFGWIPALLPARLRAAPEADSWLLLMVLALILLGRFVKLTLDYARSVYVHVRSERYRERVAADTFRRVLSFGRQYFDQNPLGSIDREVGWSASPLRMLGAAEDLLVSAVGLVVKVGVMLALSWPLTVVLAIVFPLIQLIMGRINTTVHRLTKEASDIERKMGAEVLDLLSSMALIKVSSQEEAAAARHSDILREARGLALRKWRVVSLRWPLAEALLLGTMMVTQGVLFYTTGEFRPGDLGRFAAFLLLLQQAFPDLHRTLGFGLALAEQRSSLEALAHLHDAEGKFIVSSGSRPFTGLERSVEVRALTFRYEGGKSDVLRGISTFIPAGKVTAIVGESGSGKTTFVDLIARLHECDPGRILFDGVDVRDFSLTTLHRRVALVSQDIWMLHRSLRENLVFGLDAPPRDHELVSVLDALGLGSFLQGLPRGLDAPLGDRGVLLSRGQRQRIAIARAVLCKPDLLILDEATSALDSVAERKVEEALEDWARGATLIVIAHRLSTVRNAHRILVMEDGRIAEEGSWSELLDRGGAFSRLHRAQFDNAEISA